MHIILETYFHFIKKLFLSQKEAEVIGLDIGASVCRAVKLKRRLDGFEVVRWAAEPFNGTDEKPALTKIIEKLGAISRSCTVLASVSGKGTLIRYIDMPRMSSSDLHKAFAMEADKYFPFPRETVHIDCSILDPKGKDKRMTVLAAAVKKDIIEARLKSLKDCGIEPSVITIASVAVGNIFTRFSPATCTQASLAGKAVAIVDIGETFTTLIIMADGMPKFTRDIFIGVVDMARSLSNIAGVPLDQARALLASGDVNGEKPDVARSIEAVLSNIVAEVRLSFDYFSTEKNLAVVRICLIGEAVQVPGVEPGFARHFDAPLVAWNPLEMIHISAEAGNRDGLVTEGRRMATALGLALSEYD